MIWNFFPGPQGGAERQCWRQARELVRQGHRCTVLTRRPLRSAPRRETVDGVQIVRLGRCGPLYEAARRMRAAVRREQGAECSAEENREVAVPLCGWLSPLRFLEALSFMAEARVYLRKHGRGLDLIHVHENYWTAGLAVVLGRRAGLPVVVKETISPPFPALMRDIPFHRTWDRLRREAEAYIALHAAAAAELKRRLPPGARVELIPNGVERPVRAAPLESGHVLMVANFDQGAAHKGFDVLLNSWPAVLRRVPAARLSVVGRGDASPWRERARQLGCEKSVVFPGAAPSVDVYYADASVFVLPSRREGLSNALLEAQSRGIPAVVSDIPGNRAVIRHGVNGLVVPVGDADALAAATAGLLENAALRRQMGAAARAAVEERFSIGAVCGRLGGLYAGLAGEKG